MHSVIYTEKARQDLKKLEIKIAQRIIGKIYFFSLQINPILFSKKLQNSNLGHYRFRIGDYRVLFDTDQKGSLYVLMILRIKHRKDIYGTS